jgi:hypothetical protein
VSPYISQMEREVLAGKGLPQTAGQLNYVLTVYLLEYLKRRTAPAEVGYAAYNEVMGVLTCIQHELYRRAIAPYEDKKIEASGDVF